MGCYAEPAGRGVGLGRGPGRPVDNGGRARCRRDGLRSEGAARVPFLLPARFLAAGWQRPWTCVVADPGRRPACALAPPGSGGRVRGRTQSHGRRSAVSRRKQGAGPISWSARTSDPTQAEAASVAEPTSPIERVAVIMPTYEERQNLETVVGRLRAAVPHADLLIVDDSSPDGTGDLADKLSEADAHIQVLHRADKAGLGPAYIAGFRWVLERGYDAVVEMDADGSHQPEQLPLLLAALDGADGVIGSRWIPGGRLLNWPKSREILSRGANLYTRLMLRLDIKDATGGYRAYRTSALRAISLDTVESAGYCFQIDLTLRLIRAGLRIVEVPITFVERERGASKMSRAIIGEAFLRVAQWGIATRMKNLRARQRPGA